MTLVLIIKYLLSSVVVGCVGFWVSDMRNKWAILQATTGKGNFSKVKGDRVNRDSDD